MPGSYSDAILLRCNATTLPRTPERLFIGSTTPRRDTHGASATHAGTFPRQPGLIQFSL
jgi:hypothetical protein